MKEILKGIYMMEKLSGCNVYLLKGDAGLILVDTGLREDGQKIVKQIEEAGFSPTEVKTIVLTHSHMDHAGSLAGLASVTGAEVAAHTDEKPYIEQKAGLPYKRFTKRLMMWLGNRILYGHKPAKVTKALKEGDDIPEAPGFRVIHTPGHTPGSICLYNEKERILICGDTLFNKNPFTGKPGLMLSLPAATVDMERVKESVKRLQQLELGAILFGHGRPILEEASSKLKALEF